MGSRRTDRWQTDVEKRKRESGGRTTGWVILKRRLVNLKGETQGKKNSFGKQGSKGIYSRVKSKGREAWEWYWNTWTRFW